MDGQNGLKRTSTRGISADFLKIFAIVTMTVDHFAAIMVANWIVANGNQVLFGGVTAYMFYRALRQIGRLAFPVFCFLIVEGFLHTRSKRNYALRLLVFALISEPPFDLGFFMQPVYMDHQNVFFTLLIGLLAIWGISLFEKFGDMLSTCLGAIACTVMGCLAAWILNVDYSFAGVVMIIAFYLTLRLPPVVRQLVTYACFLAAMYVYDGIWQVQTEAISIISFVLMIGYNGVRRMRMNKYFFYAYYPVHIAILALITWALI